MNHVIVNVAEIIQLILQVLTGIATLYILVFAFAGLFYSDKRYPESKKSRKIAVLIPGYKEDNIIIEVASAALKQDYQTGNYDVVIIADSFRNDTLEALRKLPVKVIEVSFDISTKSKALNKAMAQLTGYDIAVVLDADNVMEPDFLSKINNVFDYNFIAVQGHRTAKNLNTSLAVLDAVSEEINNHIFRKGHRVLGLSSAIIGSGMAFDYEFFKNLMSKITAIGGFDKEIELKMLKEGHKIEYLDNALVYDEKVQKAEVFSNQRRRWLSAQLHYFRLDFMKALTALFTKGNIDYFDKAIQFIQPPRILLLGAVILFSALFLTLNFLIGLANGYSVTWIVILVSCVLAFLFSVPGSFYNIRTLKAMLSLPAGMLLMLGSLLRIKGANKKFIHTQHGVTTQEKK